MRERLRVRRLMAGLCGLAWLAAVAVSPLTTRAQPQPKPEANKDVADALTATPDEINGIIARAITRIVMVDLKLTLRPGEAEYGIATALLNDAADLDPGDPDILRLLIEATTQTGDLTKLEALNWKLLKLDPDDAILTLNLLSSAISRSNTADERIKQYEKFLGPKGDNIDAGVRSRLALDAALLYREQGDAASFTRLLKKSLELDITNKDAALLFVSVVQPRQTEPVGRFKTLLILLTSDPVDQQTHLTIARELSSCGASTGSMRFFDNYLAMMRKLDFRPEEGVLAERFIEQWRSQSAGKAYWDLAGPLITQRRAVQGDIDKMVEALRIQGKDEATIEGLKQSAIQTGRLQDPMTLACAPELNRVWVAAASSAGDQVFTSLGLQEMQASLDITEQSLAQIENFKIYALMNKPVLKRLEGWLKMREGEMDAAAELLKSASADGDLLADLGLAVMKELSGDPSGSAAALAELAFKLSGTLEGAWAASTAERLVKGSVKPFPGAADVEAAVTGVPGWLDQLATDPSASTGLAVIPEATRVKPLDKAVVKIVVRNLSLLTLGIGNERSISGRGLISQTNMAGGGEQSLVVPGVISLERRTKLEANSEFNLKVWADPGVSGWVADLMLGEPARVRFKLLSGFRVEPVMGRPMPRAGKASKSAESELIIRQGVPGATIPIADLAAQVKAAPADQFPYVLAAARHRIYRDEQDVLPMNANERAMLVGALIDRYTKADVKERLMLLAMMPSGRFLKDMLDFDLAVARIVENDERLLRLKVVSRATAKDHPILVAGENSPDPLTKAVAGYMRARLSVDLPKTYSRMPSTFRWELLGQ